MRLPRLAAAAAALLLAALPAGPARAQDVEARALASGRGLPRGYFERVREDPGFFEVARGWRATAAAAARSSAPLGGRLAVVVVPALFADSPEPAVSAAEMQRVLFDGPAPAGTLTAYYSEVSRGRLRVTGRVLPWVRTGVTRAVAAGGSNGLGEDARTGDYLVQALRAQDPGVDFGEFDNDGPDGRPNSGDDDGFVDAVAFNFTERAAPCLLEGIWPHRARIRAWTGGAPFRTDDRRPSGEPVLVDDYIVQSAVRCSGSGAMPVSVIAHELGHVLGLPDLYDATAGLLPAQRRWVLGCWTLMAGGAWGCGDGSAFAEAERPPHMGPWEKAQLGWANEEMVPAVRDREYVLEPVGSGGRTLLVPMGGSEFLQVEYRPRAGFDADLPAGGVLIYHVDTSRPLRPCPTCPRIYRVALEEADGNAGLLRSATEGGNRGEAGDVWGASGPASFSNATTPSTAGNGGTATTITFHSIRVEGGVARVRVSTAAAPQVVAGQLPPGGALAAYRGELRAAGGALPYQWSVQGTLPQGLALAASGESAILSGTPLESGSFAVTLQLRDALGAVGSHPVTLRVEEPAPFALARLLAPLTRSGAPALAAEEQAYLDRMGNRNGRYDVGDLRAYLRAHPSLAPSADRLPRR